MQAVIVARNLVKQFGALTAVDNVSFDLGAGECLGILGPNGAGKTSTIRMIYGLSPLTAGSLRVFDLEIAEHARQIKGRIGVCQQENNLDPELTVRQNLEIFARYFDIPRKIATERTEYLLKFMLLDHKAHATSAELSGGMMRRLVVARALINQPQLLILDEPTTGLDPQSRQQVWGRIEELKRQGLSVLLTTHYMEEASRLCDRVIIMDQGRILVEGKPRELIKAYAGHDIVEISHPDDPLREYLQSVNLAFEDLGHRLIIQGNDDRSVYREICQLYPESGCLLRMATLEDVFLTLTGRDLRD
jgi:lipooligosaccharide transport system ATP-binding protein